MTTKLTYNALRLETAGKEQEKFILNAITSCGISKLCYAYKSRVKSEDRLVEKVKRKLKEKKDYQLSTITDVIGLRLITLFRNEIPKVLTEVLLLIGHFKDLSPNPFQKECFEEVIIYTNSPRFDPFLAELRAVMTARGVNFTVTDSEEGYSSVHIVTRIIGTAKLHLDTEKPTEHRLPVEIQIRSVFEDAWGEIDHRFGYVVRSGKDNRVLNSSLVQPHLKVLKQFTDACAQYADTIYTSANAPVAVEDSSGKILSVASDDFVLQKFRDQGVSDTFCSLYTDGRVLRERALALVAKDRAAGQAECLKAASYFLAIHQQAKLELSPQAGSDLFVYYAKMNEALCLLSTDSPAHVQLAESIYIELKEHYPKFLLIQFRLAQAYGRLGKNEESIELFLQIEKEIKIFEGLAKEAQFWPDELPLIDYEHISGLLPKLLGYQYWKRSQIFHKNGDHQGQLAELLSAFQITRDALLLRAEDHNIHNNLAFYAMEYLTTYKGEPDSQYDELTKVLNESIDKLEKHAQESPAADDIALLDTLVRAYNCLGDASKAINIASRIVELVKNSTQGNPEETLEILKFALQIQSDAPARVG